jgi:glycosyltransferase involved in cell wall biosynthesis
MSGGGAERVALALIRAFVERGYELDLVLTQARGELLPLLPQEVRVWDLHARRLRNAIWPLVRYLRERRPDALQVSMWPLTVVGILAHKLSRCHGKLVVSDHAVLSDHHPSSGQQAVISTTIRMFYPWAEARITPSEGVARDLATLARLPDDFFTVIPNPIEFPGSIERNPEVEALWKGASRRILTIGKLKEEKRQDLLIRAFARLPRSLNAGLMIAGTGALLSSLQDLARAEGVGDRVHFPGYFDDPWPLYASADLFALSSREEAFGNVLVEALYAGLPIVSSRSIGAEEILDGGRFGSLASSDPEALAEAMQSALDEPHRPEPGRARALHLCGESVARYQNVMLADA